MFLLSILSFLFSFSFRVHASEGLYPNKCEVHVNATYDSSYVEALSDILRSKGYNLNFAWGSPWNSLPLECGTFVLNWPPQYELIDAEPGRYHFLTHVSFVRLTAPTRTNIAGFIELSKSKIEPIVVLNEIWLRQTRPKAFALFRETFKALQRELPPCTGGL
jgi:hypothetical protein